jgi:hypothetical protein
MMTILPTIKKRKHAFALVVLVGIATIKALLQNLEVAQAVTVAIGNAKKQEEGSTAVAAARTINNSYTPTPVLQHSFENNSNSSEQVSKNDPIGANWTRANNSTSNMMPPDADSKRQEVQQQQRRRKSQDSTITQSFASFL